MESKVIIFLALASLAQAATSPAWKAGYGLTKEQNAVLDQVIAKFDNASTVQFNEWNKFFGLFVDPVDYPANGPSGLDSILAKLGATGKLAYEGLLIAFPGCTAVAESQAKAVTVLSDIVKKISTDVKSAKFGSLSKNRVNLESNRAAVRKNFAESLGFFYLALKSCFGTKDEAILALLTEGQANSTLALDYLTNAIYNGIEARSNVTAASQLTDTKYRITITQYEVRGLLGARTDRVIRYGFMDTAYIVSQLKETGIFTELYEIQYSSLESRSGFVPSKTSSG